MADHLFSAIFSYYHLSTWPQLILLSTTLYALYYFLIILYNLYFHPLRNIPGPLLARSTRLYHIYNTVYLDGHLSSILPDLHAHYGPVLRIAPNTLSFSTITAYNTIYHSSSAPQKFLKLRRFYDVLSLSDTLTFITDPIKARKRRDLVAPEYKRERVLHQYQQLITKTYSRLVERMVEESPPTVSINLYRACRAGAQDVIMTLVQGPGYDAVERPKFADDLLVLMEESGTVHNPMVHFKVVRWLLNYVLPFMTEWVGLEFKSLEAVKVRMRRMYRDVTKRISEGKDAGEEAGGEPLLVKMTYAGYKEKEVVEEAIGFIFAGTDGVGNALMTGITHIIRSPGLEEELLEELQTVWPDATTSPPPLEDLEKLPFLAAVVRESFRLGYGLPGILWREPVADSIIDGVHVPKGTALGIAATVMHLNPDIFPSPNEFLPSRWLDRSDVSAHLQRQQAFVSFTKGQRMCAGRDLAYAELTIGMAILIRRLKMELEEGQREMSMEKLLEWRDHFGLSYEGKHVHVYAKMRKE